MSRRMIPLVACGILEKEIRSLIEKNGWPVAPLFLPSSLHTDFDKLRRSVAAALRKQSGLPGVILYGACHPLIDEIAAGASAVRTPGQNCIEILLGSEIFARELANGAFFLFEDWALHWDEVTGEVFRGSPEIMKNIFRDAHSHLLCVRTPCSSDFSAQAADVACKTSLELKWFDAGLEYLEKNLGDTIKAVEEAWT